MIVPDDFFSTANRRIFTAMLRLDARRVPIGFVVLKDELARTGELEEVGGPAYITALVDGVPRSTNVEYYAQIVKDKSVKRQWIFAANKILALSYADDEDAATVSAAVDGYIRDVIERQAPQGFVSLEHVWRDETMPALEEAYATKTGLVGLSTGFAAWDGMTGGLRPGTLTLLAGSTSVGKTSLLTGVLRHIAVEQKRPVGMFSLEMSKGEICLRLLIAQARVDGQRLTTGHLPEGEWRLVADALEVLSLASVHVDDAASIGVPEMRARGRRLKQEHGCAVIAVDYVQLVQGPSTKRVDTRALELADISRGLKSLAKELQVPVLVLSQLNRASAQQNRRPQLSDLRDSGALEQDSDGVLFLYRDPSASSDLVEVILAKNRSGPTGSFQLRWFSREMRFATVSEDVLEPI
jgi:replicative DNA helicase